MASSKPKDTREENAGGDFYLELCDKLKLRINAKIIFVCGAVYVICRHDGKLVNWVLQTGKKGLMEKFFDFVSFCRN